MAVGQTCNIGTQNGTLENGMRSGQITTTRQRELRFARNPQGTFVGELALPSRWPGCALSFSHDQFVVGAATASLGYQKVVREHTNSPYN